MGKAAKVQRVLLAVIVAACWIITVFASSTQNMVGIRANTPPAPVKVAAAEEKQSPRRKDNPLQ